MLGALRQHFNVFLFFFLQKCFYHICKMKWAKSEEKIEVGEGPWKLGVLPDGVPSPLQMSGCATADDAIICRLAWQCLVFCVAWSVSFEC